MSSSPISEAVILNHNATCRGIPPEDGIGDKYAGGYQMQDITTGFNYFASLSRRGYGS